MTNLTSKGTHLLQQKHQEGGPQQSWSNDPHHAPNLALGAIHCDLKIFAWNLRPSQLLVVPRHHCEAWALSKFAWHLYHIVVPQQHRCLRVERHSKNDNLWIYVTVGNSCLRYINIFKWILIFIMNHHHHHLHQHHRRHSWSSSSFQAFQLLVHPSPLL